MTFAAVLLASTLGTFIGGLLLIIAGATVASIIEAAYRKREAREQAMFKAAQAAAQHARFIGLRSVEGGR